MIELGAGVAAIECRFDYSCRVKRFFPESIPKIAYALFVFLVQSRCRAQTMNNERNVYNQQNEKQRTDRKLSIDSAMSELADDDKLRKPFERNRVAKKKS